MRVSRALGRFRRDRSAATAVEFALIAAPFLATLFAVFELAFVSFETEQLSAAVSAGARAMLTGRAQAQNVSTAAQFVSTYLCPAQKRLMPSNFDCSKLVVDVRPSSTFTGNNLSNDIYKSGNAVFCPGTPGQIVTMRVTYPLRAALPLNLMNMQTGVVNDVPGQAGWFHILMGETIFQAELYTNGYTPPAGC